ncbi:MAG: DUF1080 domain-containing protein [Pirellulaceae bacterium]
MKLNPIRAGIAPLACLLGLVSIHFVSLHAAEQNAEGVWTSTDDPTLPADYAVQGEFVGQVEGGGKLAAQVIALGDGAFQAVLLPGGLPGAGWDGEHKILMQGSGDGAKTVFAPAAGDRRYLGKSAEEFSATSKFPPVGQKDYTAVVSDGKMMGKTDDGAAFTLKRTVRKSPTLGKKPPEGATVLFDGEAASMENFKGGRLDEQTGLLNTDGKDILTKDDFNNYVMHIEFMLPYRPAARGQGRGNSGFYQVDHYEVQVLDSFGLDGKNNECGGVYTNAEPLVNMCLPPLTWQTYDVEFTNAVVDDQGNKLSDAVMTLKHNGVVIHDKLKINGKTGGSRPAPEGTPGPIKLQGHGNPLQYRNVWILEKK